jgi:hypothetical protein
LIGRLPRAERSDRIGGIYDPPFGVADQRGAEAAALRHSHSQGANVRRVFCSRSLNSPCHYVVLTIASCTSGTQLLFNGFAEFDRVRRHVRCDVAVLEEGQDPVDPSGMAFGFLPLDALRSGALTSSVYKLPGGFGLERKNRNETIAIDVDQ